MGVLNALCYPSGHCMELSYQKSYVSPSIFENRKAWKDRTGYFVFIDYKGGKDGDHSFIPIRKVQVKKIYPVEEAQEYADSTRIYFRIELGELILFKEEWNEQIKSVPSRPTPNSQPTCYVLGHSDFSPGSSKRSQRDIWDDLVVHVAASKSLNDCVFLSTGHIKEFENHQACSFTPYKDREGAEKAYQLRPSSIYELGLRVFNTRHSAESTQEIVVRSSSDLLVVSQPFATTVGGPSDHSVLISCKRTIENTLATLEVSLKQRADTADPAPKEGQALPATNVIAAKPLYRLSLSVSRGLLWGFIGLVFVGVFLTSTSKEIFADLCLTKPDTWAMLAKFVGAGCLAGAAFLGFRKLPSGS